MLLYMFKSYSLMALNRFQVSIQFKLCTKMIADSFYSPTLDIVEKNHKKHTMHKNHKQLSSYLYTYIVIQNKDHNIVS